MTVVPYVFVRGVHLYYEEHGAGPHLLVAHGALGSIATMPSGGLDAATLARRGLHVVWYDARGHGRSGYTTASEDYDVAALAEDMLGVMDALGLERTSIYGASMGASTALMVALARPERVDRLVLRAPSPFDLDARTARVSLGALALVYRLAGSSAAARLVTMLSGSPDRARVRLMLRSQRRDAIVPALRGFLARPLTPEHLTNMRTPTLILTHPGDRLHPLRSGEILRAHLPHANLAVGASRMYWREHPDVLTDAVASFVKRSA